MPKSSENQATIIENQGKIIDQNDKIIRLLEQLVENSNGMADNQRYHEHDMHTLIENIDFNLSTMYWEKQRAKEFYINS